MECNGCPRRRTATGRPWDRTQPPMMIIGALLVLTAGIVISVVGTEALRSGTDSTPDVQVGPGE